MLVYCLVILMFSQCRGGIMSEKSMSIWQNKGGYSYANCNGVTKRVGSGVRVEEIENPLMQNIRYLDKLIDELAKGKAMEKVLR